MTDRRRAARIVAEWRQRRETGAEESPADLLRAHPDLADELRVHLELQQRLEVVAPNQAPPNVGPPTPLRERIGDFRILREIGRGGMGVVYEAEQISMRRPVALKVLFPGVTLDPKAVARFRREAQAAGRLHHTNIVAVYGMGDEDGVFFYAMERIEGRTLAAVVTDLKRLGGSPPDAPAASDPSSWVATGSTGRVFFARAASAFAGLADALEHAHAAGIVHRDVKPSNVMLDAEGVLKLTDFGLARVEEGGAALTLTGDVLGTPAYMSPEQIRPGTEPLDARTDVYSLGATLYEFLCLRPPHQGATPQDLFARILTEDPSPPRRWNPRIPKDLDTIVGKATERDPARRYRTSADFARDLRLFADGAGIQARRMGPLGRAWRTVRRRPTRSALIAAVLALVATVAFLAVEGRSDHVRLVDLEYSRLLAQAEELRQRDWMARVLGGERLPGDEGTIRARAALEAAVALAPARPEAYLDLALLRGDPDERLAQLDRARERGLLERTYRAARATIEAKAGRDTAARDDRALMSSLPEGGGWRDAFLEARLRRGEGRWKEAIQLFTTSIERQHADGTVRPFTFLARAQAREMTGDYAGALEDLAKFQHGSNSSGPFVEIWIASLWRRLGHADLAEAGFSRALAVASKDGSSAAWAGVCMACDQAREFPWLDRAADLALTAHPTDASLMRLRAQGLMTLERRVEALRWADEALRLEPNSREGHLLRGMLLCAAGDSKEALVEARKARALDPTDARCLTLEAKALLTGGKRPEAIVLLRDLVERSPNDHEAFSLLGEALSEEEKPDDALPVVRRALQLVPLCPRCRNLEAQVLHRAGLLDEALARIDDAITLFPSDGILYSTRGTILAAKGRDEDALSAYEKAVGLAPDEESARFNHASLQLKLHRFVAAIDESSASVRRFPSSARWPTLLGRAYAASGQPILALAAFEEALKLDPRGVDAHAAKGELLLSLDRLAEAVPEMKRSADLEPKNGEVRNFLAGVLATTTHPALRDPTGAVGWAREAVAIDGRNGNFRNTLGIALRAAGKPEEALKAWAEAAPLMPDSDMPSRNRVVTLLELGHVADARAEATAGVGNHPASADWQVLLGKTYAASGQHAPAFAAFGRAIELDGASPAPYLARGDAFVPLGMLREALADWQRAADLNRADAATRHRLAIALVTAPDASLRDPERAVALEREAIQIDGRNPDYRNMLGGALAQAGHPEEALAVWEKTLAEFHGGPGVEHNRVDLLLELGRNAVALAEATAGVGRRPSDAYSRWQLGRAYIASGQAALAVEPLDKAIELDAKNSEYYCTRGDVLQSIGRLPEALRDWQSGASLNPGNATVRNTMAWILATSTDAKLRDARRAVVLAEEAVHIDERAGDAWNTLGVALCRDGQWRKAIEALEESAKRSEGGTAFDWYFAAIAHKRLGEDAKAKECFDRAATWEAGNAAHLAQMNREELTRFRHEAEETLGTLSRSPVTPPAMK